MTNMRKAGDTGVAVLWVQRHKLGPSRGRRLWIAQSRSRKALGSSVSPGVLELHGTAGTASDITSWREFHVASMASRLDETFAALILHNTIVSLSDIFVTSENNTVITISRGRSFCAFSSL